jgi:hypothetical protein
MTLGLQVSALPFFGKEPVIPTSVPREPPVSKGAPVAGHARHELGGAEISAIESTLFMFLLPLKKGGNPVAQMGEHRTRISLTVDRRFEARDFVIQTFVF